MEKFNLENYLYGAETPVKQLEDGSYDTDIPLPIIPEGDVAYFVTVNLWIKSNNELFDDFQHILRIVSLNSMTGFEVDAQREQFIQDYMSQINN
jgi:hypothetical protein